MQPTRSSKEERDEETRGEEEEEGGETWSVMNWTAYTVLCHLNQGDVS